MLTESVSSWSMWAEPGLCGGRSDDHHRPMGTDQISTQKLSPKVTGQRTTVINDMCVNDDST